MAILTFDQANPSVLGTNNDDSITGSGDLTSGNLIAQDGADQLTYTLSEGDVIEDTSANGNEGDDTLEFLSKKSGDNFIRSSWIYGGKDNDNIIFGDKVILDGGTIVEGNIGEDSIEFKHINGALVNGNTENDTLKAAVGADLVQATIHGGQGEDHIEIGDSSTVDRSYIYGDKDDDYIKLGGGYESTQVYGNQGADTIEADIGSESINPLTVFGGQGNDLLDLFAMDGGIRIFGDLDDDYIIGGGGADTLTGGNETDADGDDTFEFTSDSGGNDLDEFSASKTLQDGDTFKFFGNIDVITDFESGADLIATDDPDADAAELGDGDALSGINPGETYFIIGDWNETTDTFTVAAGGDDTLIYYNATDNVFDTLNANYAVALDAILDSGDFTGIVS